MAEKMDFSHSSAQQISKYPSMNINVKEIWNIDKNDVVDGNMNAVDIISNRSVGA